MKEKSKKIINYLKYSAFLLMLLILIFKIITKETTINFIFLGLLVYIFVLKLDPRISIGSALILIAYCSFLLIFKKEEFANQIALYSYYFLVIGIVKQFFDYIIDLRKGKIKNNKYQQ